MKPIVPAYLANLTTAPASFTSSGWALTSLALAMLLSSLGTSIANVGLPTLAGTFAASFQAVQWVVLAYLLAVTTLIVGVGRIGDRVGRRRMLLAGLALFTVASVLCGLAPSLHVLVAARILQGVGGAAMMALTLTFVADTVPKVRTGRAMGLLGTMSAIGTALGPSLGGVLLASFGWRALFFVNVPLCMVALFLVWRHLPRDRRAPSTTQPKFDVAGMVLLALTLAAFALALTLGRGQFGPFNAGLLFVAAGGAGLFMLVEARAPAPLLPLAFFRERALRTSLVLSALVSLVVMTTLVVGPFYLSRSLALDASAVGLVLSAGPLVSALSGLPAGRAVDRFGLARTTLAGLSGMATGAALLALLPTRLGVPGYLGPLVLLTAGYAFFQASNNTAVMANLGPDRRGVISGLLNLARNLGLVTGASAMGAVFALGSATSDVTTAPPEAVATGMRVAFTVAAALLAGALGLATANRAAPREKVLSHSD